MKLSKKETSTIYTGKSKHGRGVYAKKDIKKDSTIASLKGTLITCYVDDDLDEITRSNTIRYSSELFLNPKGEIGELFNHSCEPNSKIVKNDKKLALVALANIAKGSEIVFDYSTVLASDDIWEMKCKCGTKSCRGIVKMFKKLTKSLRDNYIKNKIVPKYILSI